MRVWLLIAALMQVMTLDVVTIARGGRSGVMTMREATIQRAADWTALWTTHAGSEPAPAVDFSTEMVAAVFLGTRPTGGFSVEILRARRDADGVTVEYAERRPDPDLLVTQALTSPYHIVRLARRDGPIRFRKVDDAGSGR